AHLHRDLAGRVSPRLDHHLVPRRQQRSHLVLEAAGGVLVPSEELTVEPDGDVAIEAGKGQPDTLEVVGASGVAEATPEPSPPGGVGQRLTGAGPAQPNRMGIGCNACCHCDVSSLRSPPARRRMRCCTRFFITNPCSGQTWTGAPRWRRLSATIGPTAATQARSSPCRNSSSSLRSPATS